MIAKTDLLLLLSDLESQGIDVSRQVNELYSTPGISLEVLKFINAHRQLDLTAFYDNLRKNYNKKRSKLYISLVREDLEPAEVLTTLAAYNLQVALYASKMQDGQMFLNHARAKEVNLVLAKYYANYDLTSCMQLLKLIKADLVACEMVEGRREG